MDSDDYSEEEEKDVDTKKVNAYDYFMNKAKADGGQKIEDDDSPISSDTDDNADSIESPKNLQVPMDDEDMDLSQSMPKKKSDVKTAGASVMSGSANFDDDEIMEMDDLIEESVEDEGDMLASGTNDGIEFDHVQVKDA
jgi:hypothetical protein